MSYREQEMFSEDSFSQYEEINIGSRSSSTQLGQIQDNRINDAASKCMYKDIFEWC